ncbi:unnamed protein product [Ectocarpus fasciculatus]
MALPRGVSLASLMPKEKEAVLGSATADTPGSVIDVGGGDGTAPAAATAGPQGQASAVAASRGGVAGISLPPTATVSPSGGGGAAPSLAARPRDGKGPNYLQQRAEPVCCSPFYSRNQQQFCALRS